MKKIIKILAFLVAIVVMSTSFGCGNQTQGGGGETPPTPTPTPPPVGEPTKVTVNLPDYFDNVEFRGYDDYGLDSQVDFTFIALENEDVNNAVKGNLTEFSVDGMAINPLPVKKNKKVVLDQKVVEEQKLYGARNVSFKFLVSKTNTEYTVNALIAIADFIINDDQELEQVNEIAMKNYVTADYRWDGYFMLGNDIEYNNNFSEYQIAPSNYRFMDLGFAEDANTRGFLGTLDGNGHYIRGLRVGEDNDGAGIFGLLGDGSVVKNIAFVDAVSESTATGHTGYWHGYLSYHAAATTIDNVFVSGYIKCTAGASYANMSFGYTKNFSPIIKNSVFIITKQYESIGTGKIFDLNSSKSIVYENVYTNDFYKSFLNTDCFENKSTKTLLTWAQENARLFNQNCWSKQQGQDGNEYFCFNNCLKYTVLN